MARAQAQLDTLKIAPIGERIQNVTYFEVEIEITDVERGARVAFLGPRAAEQLIHIHGLEDLAVIIP